MATETLCIQWHEERDVPSACSPMAIAPAILDLDNANRRFDTWEGLPYPRSQLHNQAGRQADGLTARELLVVRRRRHLEKSGMVLDEPVRWSWCEEDPGRGPLTGPLKGP